MRATFLFIAIVVALLPAAFAQTGPVVEITTATAPVDVLTIQDIDFINATTPKWFFTIDLRVPGGVPGQPATVMATMRLTLDVALSTGENFSNFSTYETVPFEIVGTRSFTNLDLASPSIKREYTLDEAAKRRVEQLALPTGFLPAGVYTFRVEVTTQRFNQTFRTSFRFVLTSPSRLELLFPLDGDRNVGEFPLFQWTFDGPRSRIAVFEMLPSQASLEEATSGVSHLDTEVGGTSFLYPAAGVRPLESGKTYVWFVEGMYSGTTGSRGAVRSRLRSFTVSAGGTNVALQSLLDDLEKALGPPHKAVFDRIRAELLSPTGQMTIDGKTISASDLIQLINQFRTNPAGVLSADLE